MIMINSRTLPGRPQAKKQGLDSEPSYKKSTTNTLNELTLKVDFLIWFNLRHFLCLAFLYQAILCL